MATVERNDNIAVMKRNLEAKVKKKEMLEYSQFVMDAVCDYFNGRITKEQLDAKLLDKINEHLGKSKIRRIWEA